MLTNSKYDKKPRVKAARLRDKMNSFNFVVNLMFMKNVIGKTKCLVYLKSLSETLFPLTGRCFRLLLTVPVTSASAERSFSKLKLVKTLMRSVMNQERLVELLIGSRV